MFSVTRVLPVTAVLRTLNLDHIVTWHRGHRGSSVTTVKFKVVDGAHVSPTCEPVPERYRKGVHEQRISELELSDHIVLRCRACGDRVVLLGREDDWYSEGRSSFACECGAKLTLADRVGDMEFSVARLMRGVRTTEGI
jgi:hypothetical protein